jgi:hypothetical protein
VKECRFLRLGGASGSRALAGYGISSIEPRGSVISESVCQLAGVTSEQLLV